MKFECINKGFLLLLALSSFVVIFSGCFQSNNKFYIDKSWRHYPSDEVSPKCLSQCDFNKNGYIDFTEGAFRTGYPSRVGGGGLIGEEFDCFWNTCYK